MNLLKGALIGTAEVIPGVSGGTLALILGVYDRIIFSASEFVAGFLALFKKNKTAGLRFKNIDLKLLLPLLVGMASALVLGAKILEPLLEQFPEFSRAAFAGMIAVSISIPFSMAGKWGMREFLLGAVAAIAAVLMTSLPQAQAGNPSGLVIVGSAAIAICALVLPGVSGSFLLLAMGMYAPTIAAVNDRDLGFLGLFALGAILGLGSFASLLQFLLSHHHKITMVVMTGLMVGSLRALWPWQDEARSFTQITEPVLTVTWFVVGAAMVLGVIFAERRFKAKSQ
ncbi:MAG: DUF368 domain-containing protein [Aquiluna sp.]|nr:DUF368 domain-containing protein [Aquiluna sp.]MCF8544937.1 DUF368 domain-containing protein [Aquiluna sp.]